MLWDKRASVFYSIGIDVDYWQQSTYLSRINGVAYKMYLRWIEKYLTQNRVFTPQSICSSEEKLSCFTTAKTWESFLSDRYMIFFLHFNISWFPCSFHKFANLSVRINAVIPPRAKESRVISFVEPREIRIQEGSASEQASISRYLFTFLFRLFNDQSENVVFWSALHSQDKNDEDWINTHRHFGQSDGKNSSTDPPTVQPTTLTAPTVMQYYVKLMACMEGAAVAIALFFS